MSLSFPVDQPVIDHYVTGTRFGFYSDAEVRKISSCQIDHTMTFTRTLTEQKAKPGGLYDPKMGLTAKDHFRERCETCGLKSRKCPGHIGHVELCEPVFNPLFFDICEKLMNRKCIHCHKFRMTAEKRQVFISRIDRIINHGDVSEIGYEQKMWRKKDKGCYKKWRKRYHVEAFGKRDYATDAEKRGVRLPLFHELLKMTGDGVICPHCGVANPKYKRESYVMLMQEKLSHKSMKQNFSLEADIPNIKEICEPLHQTRVVWPVAVREQLKLLWAMESDILDPLFKSIGSDESLFFRQVLVVPPNRFRPALVLQHMGALEHQQNKTFKLILKTDDEIREVKRKLKEFRDSGEMSNDIRIELNEQFQRNYTTLQRYVNILIDNTKGGGKEADPGIRQILEKKEGLFRMNTMGKRVNFCARSVINPDPSLKTSEVGVPDYVAKILTYPEPVNAYNLKKLQKAVRNGPFKHPGATAIVENGYVTRLDRLTQEELNMEADKLLQTASMEHQTAAKQQSFSKHVHSNTKVVRHMENDDIVLMNRQPSLHKASIMAHRVRVQYNSKVLRFHYANCESYNADFDGDEMNLHLPQNEVARSEAYHIMNTTNQFCVPKDGSPLRGLIQDHVDAGVLMCKRDTFLTRGQVMQLLHNGLTDMSPERAIEIGPPAILKPTPLYTGKQLVNFILKNTIPKRKQRTEDGGTIIAPMDGITMDKKGQVPGDVWNGIQTPSEIKDEFNLVVRQSYICTGVLDKKQLAAGKTGSLVHALASVYGYNAAEAFLTATARVFSGFLQEFWGFSARIEDFIVIQKVEKARNKLLKNSVEDGVNVAVATALNQPADAKNDISNELTNCNTIKSFLLRGKENIDQMDTRMMNYCNKLSSAVVNATFPNGCQLPFPKNYFLTMILAGAKGSKVNMSQILSCLGQQTLEGQRVPRLITGKTLPAFAPFDPSPRAGGFVQDRFLTGLKPEEYFFHCMAGREGLVDTAVKTSNSGYLQRCLIKHLESVQVKYDYTARDNDDNIIQFIVGEDALDTTRTAYLEKFKFLVDNFKDIDYSMPKDFKPSPILKAELNMKKKAIQKAKKSGKIMPLPTMSTVLPCVYGNVSERYAEAIRSFASSHKKYLEEKGISKQEFKRLCYMRLMKCLHSPGEMVGIVAAQSIGEPSTQMTLNTFHLAGHGGANVTLGIPRIRELVMTASQQIKTPTMTFFCHSEKDANHMRSALERITFDEMVQKRMIYGPMVETEKGKAYRVYKICYDFRSDGYHGVDDESIRLCMSNKFSAALNKAIYNSPAVIKSRLRVVQGKADPDEDAKSKKKKNEEEEEVMMPKPTGGDEEFESDDENSEDDEKQAEEDPEEPSESEEVAFIESANDGSDVPTSGASEADAGDGRDSESEAPSSSGGKKRAKRSKTAKVGKETSVKNITFGKSEDGGVQCNVVIQIPINAGRLLLQSLLDDLTPKLVIRDTPGITACFYEPPSGKKKVHKVVTQGLNFKHTMHLCDHFDATTWETNSIWHTFQKLGVEAGRSAIVREINNVFGGYGIDVSERHLGLVSDYMTWLGSIRGFNSRSIHSNASPYQRMTFEQSTRFLSESCLVSDYDDLRSPSGSLIHGTPCSIGTNSFEVLASLKPPKEGEFWNTY